MGGTKSLRKVSEFDASAQSQRAGDELGVKNRPLACVRTFLLPKKWGLAKKERLGRQDPFPGARLGSRLRLASKSQTGPDASCTTSIVKRSYKRRRQVQVPTAAKGSPSVQAARAAVKGCPDGRESARLRATGGRGRTKRRSGGEASGRNSFSNRCRSLSTTLLTVHAARLDGRLLLSLLQTCQSLSLHHDDRFLGLSRGKMSRKRVSLTLNGRPGLIAGFDKEKRTQGNKNVSLFLRSSLPSPVPAIPSGFSTPSASPRSLAWLSNQR